MFEKTIANRIYNDLDFLAHYTKCGIIYVNGEKVKHTVTFRNRKCHQNSYDKYLKDNNYKVKMAWCINKSNSKDYFVHFVNYNNKTKEYYDDTLGGDSRHYYYYILSDTWLWDKIDKEDSSPSTWLAYLKDDFYKRYVIHWWERLFIKKEDM